MASTGPDSSASTALVVPMSPLGKKVPMVKAPPGVTNQQRWHFEHQAFVESVNILYSNRDLARDCRDYLQELLRNKVMKSRLGEEAATRSAQTLAAYQEDWLARWVAGKLAVSMAVLGIARRGDSKLVSLCAAAILNASVSTMVPEECCSDAVMTACCDERTEAAGNRHTQFL